MGNWDEGFEDRSSTGRKVKGDEGFDDEHLPMFQINIYEGRSVTY